MPLDRTAAIRYLRTLLILGRASNLPTVWSNCLAGWLLGGGGEARRLGLICLGATLVYVGGMYLNDAFDAQFDQQHRPERPIPSGAIRVEAVWMWGLGLLLLGFIGLCLLGRTTGFLAALLVISILIYDAIHKIFTFSPVLMALCRFFLVVAAASSSADGVAGLSIWSALVLAAYIVGVSYLARKESTRAKVRYWPCVFLAAPIVLALVVNQEGFKRQGLVLIGIVLSWIIASVRHAFWSPQPNIGLSVSALLAGIVLVDLLAVGGENPLLTIVFLLLFFLALLFQRFIPAT